MKRCFVFILFINLFFSKKRLFDEQITVRFNSHKKKPHKNAFRNTLWPFQDTFNP